MLIWARRPSNIKRVFMWVVLQKKSSIWTHSARNPTYPQDNYCLFSFQESTQRIAPAMTAICVEFIAWAWVLLWQFNVSFMEVTKTCACMCYECHSNRIQWYMKTAQFISSSIVHGFLTNIITVVSNFSNINHDSRISILCQRSFKMFVKR